MLSGNSAKNKLFVIGNGFDQHYGIKSSYSHFKSYVSTAKEFRAVSRNIDIFLPVDQWWSNFEEAMAGLDADQITDEASMYLVSYGADDWSDADHHSYEFAIDEIIKSLTEEMKEAFFSWLNNLEIPRPDQKLSLPPDAKYLTFNYTPTLEILHTISKKNIFYIHGKRDDLKSIVLGHGLDPDTLKSLNDGVNDPSDVRVYNGNALIDKYYGNTHKQTVKIIQRNKSFFMSLKNISEVYVLGHSLAKVDIPYFEEILKNVSPHAMWNVSYYSPNEITHHKNVLEGLGVKSENIKMIQMQDLYI